MVAAGAWLFAELPSVSSQSGFRFEVVEGSSTVAVGPGSGGRIFRVIGGVLGIAGIVIMIVSAVRDTRRRAENAEPPPSPWSSGEWPATGSAGDSGR